MPSTSPLPVAPGPDDFRALARSSPWRFGTLHFTHRAEDKEPVEAWLTRPGHLEVLSRGKRHIATGVPHTRSVLSLPDLDAEPTAPLDAEPGLAPPDAETSAPGRLSGVTPQSVEPVRRGDGLVAIRPDAVEIEFDDPMWQNYRWVAMLDPVELSHGVEVSEVHVRERFGRLTWTATVRALPASAEDASDGYAPRCSCCPLLFGEVSQSLEFDAGNQRSPSQEEVAGYPSAYWVSLDVETGVVVDVEPQDGDRSHTAFTNEIHEAGQWPARTDQPSSS